MMAIKIGRRRRSFLKWIRFQEPASADRPNFLELETASGEAAMVADVQNMLERILGGHQRIPKVTPGDIRKALEQPIERDGTRLQWVARRIITPAVILEAVQIALGRAPYRFSGRTGTLASILAAAIVTGTPFIERHRKNITPPNSAPKDPENRHTPHSNKAENNTTSKKAPYPKHSPIRENKSLQERLASIKRSNKHSSR